VADPTWPDQSNKNWPDMGQKFLTWTNRYYYPDWEGLLDFSCNPGLKNCCHGLLEIEPTTLDLNSYSQVPIAPQPRHISKSYMFIFPNYLVYSITFLPIISHVMLVNSNDLTKNFSTAKALILISCNIIIHILFLSIHTWACMIKQWRLPTRWNVYTSKRHHSTPFF